VFFVCITFISFKSGFFSYDTNYIFLHYDSGTARGVGWQKIGAYINLGSYYIVGIPSAVVLAFALHIGGKVIKK
jgi:hypothetical protein